jgi:6-phosphogluconolactonase
MRTVSTILLLGIAYLHAEPVTPHSSSELWIGTQGGHGLYHCSINPENGHLSPAKRFPADAASVLARSRANHITYTAGKNTEGQHLLTAVRITDGTILNRKEFSGSCYLAISPDKKLLFSANIGGQIDTFRINADGSLGDQTSLIELKAEPGRKKFAPHAVVPSPDGRFLIVPDIAGNRICRLKIEPETGKLTELSPVLSKRFHGPRHFCFDSESKTAYLVNQMGEAVTVFRYTADDGTLTEIGHEPSLPEDQLTINNHIAEIKIHPSGKFLYVSNRGHDSIALFRRDQKTGMIRFIECVNSKGKGPISFTIDQKGRHLYCANRKSSNITIFRINPDTGKLRPISQTISVPEPVCLSIFNQIMKP